VLVLLYFKTIGHSLTKLTTSQKTLRPNWCPKLVTGLVASTKQAQRLQTGLHLRDSNATMMTGFGGSMFMDLLL